MWYLYKNLRKSIGQMYFCNLGEFDIFSKDHAQNGLKEIFYYIPWDQKSL